MMFTEAMHDVRIIRLNGPHLPPAIKRWLDVVERFIRTARDTMQYRFTVDDPDTWATAWTAEVLFRTLAVRLFESACHEGDHDRD
jgi:hypothetical protein